MKIVCLNDLDRDWEQRHGWVGELFDLLTFGAFARFVQKDERPSRRLARGVTNV